MAVAVQERLSGSTAAVPMASKYARDAGSFWAYQHCKHWQRADRLMLNPCVSPAEAWSGCLATHTLAEKETWVSCAPPICKAFGSVRHDEVSDCAHRQRGRRWQCARHRRAKAGSAQACSRRHGSGPLRCLHLLLMEGLHPAVSHPSSR